MHESIYSTTRSCEPLLNRTAFSFRSPFIGRNLRSLKRRHGTTRADLYIASLPLPLPPPYLSFSLSHWVSCYAFRFMGILQSENIQPVSFRDVKAQKTVSQLCIRTRRTLLRREQASITGNTFYMSCLIFLNKDTYFLEGEIFVGYFFVQENIYFTSESKVFR